MSNRAKLVNPFCYNPRITAQYIVCTLVTSCHLTRNQSRNLNQISWHGTITTYQQPALYCCNVIALFKHFHASLWNIFVFHLFFYDAYLIWFGWKYWMKYCCLASLILQYFWRKNEFLKLYETKLQLRSRLLFTYWHTNLWNIWYTYSIAKENIHEFLNISLYLNKV